MFKSLATKWNNASLADKVFISYIGMWAVVTTARIVIVNKN